MGLRGVAVRRFSLVICRKMRGQGSRHLGCGEGQPRNIASAAPVSEGFSTPHSLHPADAQPQRPGLVGRDLYLETEDRSVF